MWLLIHDGIKVKPCKWKGAQVVGLNTMCSNVGHTNQAVMDDEVRKIFWLGDI